MNNDKAVGKLAGILAVSVNTTPPSITKTQPTRTCASVLGRCWVMGNVELRFDNYTARGTHALSVSRSAVSMIMGWYGSHFAGDDYGVTVDGTEIKQDINGERLFDVIEVEANQ